MSTGKRGQRAQGFLRGVRSEFKKIAWPTKEKLAQYTTVVIIMSLLLSIFVYGLDAIFRNLLQLIIR